MNAKTTAHSNCDHAATKAARAKCRRQNAERPASTLISPESPRVPAKKIVWDMPAFETFQSELSDELARTAVYM